MCVCVCVHVCVTGFFSLQFLKGQRTVYRLTLVKEWNTEELENYASLVARGNPDFIEVKVCSSCYLHLVKTYNASCFVFNFCDCRE